MLLVLVPAFRNSMSFMFSFFKKTNKILQNKNKFWDLEVEFYTCLGQEMGVGNQTECWQSSITNLWNRTNAPKTYPHREHTLPELELTKESTEHGASFAE